MIKYPIKTMKNNIPTIMYKLEPTISLIKIIKVKLKMTPTKARVLSSSSSK